MNERKILKQKPNLSDDHDEIKPKKSYRKARTRKPINLIPKKVVTPTHGTNISKAFDYQNENKEQIQEKVVEEEPK